MNTVKTNPKITLLIIVIGGLLCYFKFGLPWILIVTICVGATGIISEKARKAIDFLWMKLAWVLCLIIPKIVLCLIFYFLLVPMALLSKLCRAKNGIALKNNTASFFKSTTKHLDTTFFEKPW